MITNRETETRVAKYIASKIYAKHYGKVIIVFQNGKVIHIIEEKSLTLDSLNN